MLGFLRQSFQYPLPQQHYFPLVELVEDVERVVLAPHPQGRQLVEGLPAPGLPHQLIWLPVGLEQGWHILGVLYFLQ